MTNEEILSHIGEHDPLRKFDKSHALDELEKRLPLIPKVEEEKFDE